MKTDIGYRDEQQDCAGALVLPGRPSGKLTALFYRGDFRAKTRDLFVKIHTDVINKIKEGGTTLTVCLGPPLARQPQKGSVLTANVGDSLSILVESQHREAIATSCFHSLFNKREIRRIQSEGGEIVFNPVTRSHLLNGKLGMARSIGDGDVGNGHSCVPFVSRYPLKGNEQLQLLTDGFLIPYDRVKPRHRGPFNRLFQSTRGFADNDNWTQVIFNNPYLAGNNTVVLAVADGHGKNGAEASQKAVGNVSKRD